MPTAAVTIMTQLNHGGPPGHQAKTVPLALTKPSTVETTTITPSKPKMAF